MGYIPGCFGMHLNASVFICSGQSLLLPISLLSNISVLRFGELIAALFKPLTLERNKAEETKRGRYKAASSNITI